MTKITRAYQETVPAIIKTGRLLIKAQERLGYGNWCELFSKNLLPFGEREAQYLMSIARHAVLSDPNNHSVLPTARSTLYALSRMPGHMVAKLIEDGRITPTTTAAKLKTLPLMRLPRLPEQLKELYELTWEVEADGVASITAEQFYLLEVEAGKGIPSYECLYQLTAWLKKYADGYKAEYDQHKEEWDDRRDEEAETKWAEQRLRKVKVGRRRRR